MELIIIAAISENNVIGKDNKLPWHIPEDLKRFKELTKGNAVLMGRKTYESIGKPLPKRTNIVLSSNKDYTPQGVITARNLDDALEQCKQYKTTYIIGGQKVYEQTIDIADKLEITHVHKTIEGDAFFPKIDALKWIEINNIYKPEYSFVTYVKNYPLK